MRRLLAITLLLGFLALASGASTVLCARDCAAVEHRHAAPAVMGTPHYHHHHDQPAAGERAVTVAGTPHCVRSAPPALVQRSLPEAPTAVGLPGIADKNVVTRSRGNDAPLRSAAIPPGPPALPPQLRI